MENTERLLKERKGKGKFWSEKRSRTRKHKVYTRGLGDEAVER